MTCKFLHLTLLTVQLPFLLPAPAAAYSVLTHEAIVDSVWDTSFKPLLLRRFPRTTADQLRQAHAYAYGGAIIQDMGYYPFGSKFFTDLVHYVRSGDFVINMLREAADVNEYAFALGAMAHYAADNLGHAEGVNAAEPLMFPKLRNKYGDTVTYEDNPRGHLRTEFSFDVLEVARGNYASQAYHDFIGFQVSRPLLERAFQDTYSLSLEDVFKDVDLALGTYRYSVSKLVPEMTKAAWAANKDEIMKAHPGITRQTFEYRLSKASYKKEWDGNYQEPGAGAHILAVVIKIMPKVGPLRTVDYKSPTPEGEALLMKSFNDTLVRVRSMSDEVRAGGMRLANLNFDIGKPTRQGEYRMADDVYVKLLVTFAKQGTQPSEAMRRNIVAFYRDPAQITDPAALAELNALKERATASK